jgi:hypothetical protein
MNEVSSNIINTFLNAKTEIVTEVIPVRGIRDLLKSGSHGLIIAALSNVK